MRKLLDKLKSLPLTRRKDTLLFEALKRAEAHRAASRLALETIAEAAETPATEDAPPASPPEAN